MYRITIAAADRTRFQGFAGHLESNPEIDLKWTQTAESTLTNIEEWNPQLMIIDEKLSGMSGIELVRKIIGINPMINTAIATGMPAGAFHDASEGLGILAHLPLSPGMEDAEALLITFQKLMDY